MEISASKVRGKEEKVVASMGEAETLHELGHPLISLYHSPSLCPKDRGVFGPKSRKRVDVLET